MKRFNVLSFTIRSFNSVMGYSYHTKQNCDSGSFMLLMQGTLDYGDSINRLLITSVAQRLMFNLL